MPASPAAIRWRAALILGLLTSTWSTLVSQLTAARIGRDAATDWMVVAAIPARDWALGSEPGAAAIAVGVLFHQWADFSWAVIFFGALGRWTAELRPLAIAAVAPVWATFTSALEWTFLVPVLPFWQPVFTLNQPYWIGLLVHLTAASFYPLYPWLRDRVAGVLPSPHRRFAAIWLGAAGIGLAGLATLAALGAAGREWPPHPRPDNPVDRRFLRMMAAHHAQGAELGLIGAERAADPHLRALARLIVAGQRGEIAVMQQWWRSWFGGDLPPPTPKEVAEMPGMLVQEELASLRAAPAPEVDARFIALMTVHHQGAVAMAGAAIRDGADPRIRLMAHAIRHAQRGEIELMRGTRGFDATLAAIANMTRPAGEVPVDGALGRRHGMPSAR